MYSKFEKTYSDMARIHIEYLKRNRMLGFERTMNIISAVVLCGAVGYFSWHVWMWIVR